jgi:peptidoglycan/LPS O-acetylase OafA/YrhL
MIKTTSVLNNVQAVRAIAVLMVIFVHLDYLLGSIGLPPFGYGGVDLFFVTSGFIMFFTTFNRPISPLDFITNRIVRIIPPYWLLTLAVFGLSLWVPSLLNSPDADRVDLLKSLFFVPFSKPNGFTEPILFIGWTLNYEMFFYALFSLCLFARPYALAMTILLLLLASLTLIGQITHATGLIIGFYTAPIVLEFGLGLLVGAACLYLPDRSSMSLRVVVAVLGLMALGLIVLTPFTNLQPWAFICGPAAFVVLLAAITLEQWRWRIVSKPLLAVGNASYSIYLTHPFITQMFQKLGVRLHTTGLASIALIVGALITACVVGYAFHVGVEKPLTAKLRRLMHARRLRPDKAAEPA